MDVRYENSPVAYFAMMMIEKRKIKWPIPIAGPGHIDEGAASEIDALKRGVSRPQGTSSFVVLP
jgi:hypothetical protein